MNRFLQAVAATLCLALFTGCGPGSGEVRGVVYCDGKPLASGAIQFLGIDGIPHAAAIGPDGSFVVRVPRGEVKVIVTCMNEVRMEKISSELRAGRAAPPEAMSENLSLIPMRYADWSTAGLSTRVTGRSNRQDFFLVSE